MAKPIDQVWVLFLVILSLPNSIMKASSTSIIVCPEMEKEALLSFKQSLEDTSNLLSSWNRKSSNCCTWKGVVCSNITGNVHELHLQGSGGYSNSSLQGKIDPSLLQLKHLKYLDLSGNDLYGRIPSFMGSLTSLEYLNLSGAGFRGKIPATIGNLSRLHTLDTSINIGNVSRIHTLFVDSLEWLRGLSQLKHLHMSWVDLTRAGGHWMQVINALPFLVDLSLRDCSLNFNLDPLMMMSELVNITSLQILDLYGNSYYYESSPIPNWIFRQSNLVFLDLSWNNFKGPIPTISHITKLQHIDLSMNDFNSTNIPDWLYSCKDLEFLSMTNNSLQGSISNAIGNLTSLTTLYLSYNQLSGEIPSGIHNLSKLQNLVLSGNMLHGEIPDWLYSCKDLTTLDLSHNLFSGEIPSGILNLSKLQFLDLSSNMLQGHIPDMLGYMLDRSLRYLSVRNNRLTGNLPMSVGRLSNLEVLVIGQNKLSGFVSESHLANLKKLIYFDASGNHLTLKVSSNWNPPFKLDSLRLGSWNLGAAGSVIPSWLQTQKSSLRALDLSNSGISGNVPAWFWEIRFLDLNLGGNQLTGDIPKCWMRFPQLLVLNLGNNNFSGSIPISIGALTNLLSLNLCNNNLSGRIPVSISNCTALVMMDLSGNDLVGNIPTEIGTSQAKLRLLILRSNKLRGKIPWSICHLNSLQIFDLSNNAFSGRIPSCLNNLTAMTLKRSLSEKIGTKSYYYGFTIGVFLESASIFTKGKETNYDTILYLVNNINLSNNNLSGGIPEELTSLMELKSLNLSRNHLTGSIPKSIGDLKQLESLDLSRNALSGDMPSSFSAMSFLSYLNLSCNNLQGRIPKNTQFDGMDNSSFRGNDLCGLPLTTKCRGDDDDGEDAGTKEDADEDDKLEIKWFYVVLSLGYAIGLSAFCTTLVFKKPRRAYFQFLEYMWDKVYVYYHITCTKLMTRAAQTS